ncbi:hypothetical protein JMUB7504_27100 [Staphylococcus aureus]
MIYSSRAVFVGIALPDTLQPFGTLIHLNQGILIVRLLFNSIKPITNKETLF